MSVQVSVIIPVYKVRDFMERCAVSLFSQTLDEGIEFIFVNDASPDDSMALMRNVLDRFPHRKSQVKIVTQPVNGGIAAARMAGFEASQGNYIIHCDSDDWVEPDIYLRLLSKALENDADIVICDYYGEFPSKSVTYSQNPGNDVKSFLKGSLEGKFHNALWNKLIQRNLYIRTVPLWEKGVDMWDDVSVTIRMISACRKIAYVPAPLYHYNQQNVNSCTKKLSEHTAGQIFRAWEIVDEALRKNSDVAEYSDALKAFRARALYGVLIRLPHDKREEWIRRFKILTSDLNSPALGKLMSLQLRLMICGYNGLADKLTDLLSSIKRILRGN